MIVNAAITAVWNLVHPILDRVPEIGIDYAGISSSSIYQWLRAALYFLPMNTVITICALSLALWVLRMVIAFLHSLWGFPAYRLTGKPSPRSCVGMVGQIIRILSCTLFPFVHVFRLSASMVFRLSSYNLRFLLMPIQPGC